MRIAIVDFDGTLYASETFELLMTYLKNHPELHPKYKQFFRSILPVYIGYKMKVIPEAKMKERSMQIYLNSLKGLSATEVDIFFEGLAEDVKKGFNPELIQRIRQHKEDNVHVMLVSGAYTPMLHAVTKEVEFDAIIGTDIPMVNESINFQAPIYHIQGSRKNEKILEALAGQTIDWKNSYAYGDSLSDLSVLELVGNPVAVSPQPKLQTIATNRNWEILQSL